MGKWRPGLVFDWGKLVLTDRLSVLDYLSPSLAELNPLFLKRARSILDVPHCLSLKFVNGVETQTVQRVFGIDCAGVACQEVFGGTPYWRTLYPKLSFDKLHETLRPMGTMTSAVEDTCVTHNLPTLHHRFPPGLPVSLEENKVTAVASIPYYCKYSDEHVSSDDCIWYGTYIVLNSL